MYTLEQLQQKTFKELKEIGWQLNVLPEGDKRQKQTWIDALVGAKLPLLELLEVSPGVEVEPVQEAIEIQAQEPIAPAVETDTGGSFDPVEFRETHVAEIENYFASFTEADRPPNRGDSGRGRIESEAKVSQSAIARTARFSPDIERDPSRAKQQWITFSARFLALYPPYFGEVNYKADATGQLNFLEPETTEEPPDPDDFDSIDAFRDAMARWDIENPEPLAVSMDSMCEWAPCPLDWYEPEAENLPLKPPSMLEPAETNETNETVSCTLEISPVSIASSSTCKFLIPVFGGFADRTNGNDEPPTAGVGARLPLPKPPSFPPMVVAEGDRSSIKQFARSAILLSGRAPPGGDAMS